MTQHRWRASRLGLLAAPAVGLLVLAGCSASGSGDDGGNEGEVQFSLTYATSNNLESPFEALAEAYMEANPDVTIDLEPQPNDTYGDTLRTQLQAGNAPDLMQTEAGSGQTRSIIPLAEGGFIAPLNEASASVIPAGSEPLFTYDGDVYGQPLGLGFIGVIVNQTTQEAASIDEWPSDLDGILAACDKAAAAGKSLFVMAGAAIPNAGITSLVIAATRVYAETPDWNEQRIAGDVTFADSDGWHETLETIVTLHEAGCYQAGAEGAGFDAITNNLTSGASVGFSGPGGSASELQTAAPDDEFVLQAFPPAEEGDQAFGLSSANYALSINAAADEQKQEAAQEFLDWLTEPEQGSLFAEVSGGLPLAGLEGLDLSDTPYEDVAVLLQNGDFTALPNAAWPNASVYDALGVGVQGLLTGQSTVDSVLEAMDAAWDQ